MRNSRRYRQIRPVFLLLLWSQLASCVEASEWACQRSSDCPGDEICRIGECVPGDTYLPAASTPDEQRGGELSEFSELSEDTDAPATPACPNSRPAAQGDLAINEVLANVPGGEAGDANADGVRDAYQDEFVEIVNRSGDLLDVSGVTLRIGEYNKFYFEEACLKPLEAAVIFGGGEPAEHIDYQVYIARARLSLGNSGGSVSLLSATGAQIDAMSYAESAAVSLTLSPEVEGSEYVAHSVLSSARIFSPGTCASGATFAAGCVPEEVSAPE